MRVLTDAQMARLRSRFQEGQGCWQWDHPVAPDYYGYGQFWLDGHLESAHRLVYEVLVGPIPDGLTIDHLCRNRGCVNPEHLEPVTNRENVLRGETIPAANAAKTHCVRGHEFTPATTRRASSGGRQCRTCENQRRREVRAQRRAAA